jgi:hypothetical protein
MQSLDVRGPVRVGKAILGSTRGHLTLGLEHYRHRLPLAPVLSQVPEEDSILRLAPVDPLQLPVRPSSSVRLLGGDYPVRVLSQPPVADTALLPVPVSSDNTPRPRCALFCPQPRGQWRLLEHTVCRGISPPRVPAPEIRPFSKAEAKRFLAAPESDRQHALYVLSVTSGARWGELNGLFWGDLYLDRRVMYIQHALKRG